jgi:hypothetical protein
MSDDHWLALKTVVDLVDESANPMDSFTAMMVFFLSVSKTMDLDQAWVAFSNASTILEGGTPSVYDESIPEDSAPSKARSKPAGAEGKRRGVN